MLSDVLILAAPVVLVLVLGVALARWDTKHWERMCRENSRPVRVALFPSGAPTLAPPLDVQAGRSARRAARHAQLEGTR